MLEISFPINVLSETSRPDIFAQTIGSVGPGAQNSRAQAADINKTATKCSNGAQMAPKPTTTKLPFPSGQEGVKALGCCRNQDFGALGPFSWTSNLVPNSFQKTIPWDCLGCPWDSSPSPRPDTPQTAPTPPPHHPALPPRPPSHPPNMNFHWRWRCVLGVCGSPPCSQITSFSLRSNLSFGAILYTGVNQFPPHVCCIIIWYNEELI